MDKKVLKAIIVDLKNKGNSYQSISNTLKDEYEVVMSRQAICGMFNRLKEGENSKDSSDFIVVLNDIINYTVIGMTPKDIRSTLLKYKREVKLNTISEVLRDERELYLKTKLEYVERFKSVYKDIDGDEIIKVLSYKGVEPTLSSLSEIVSKAAYDIICNDAIKILVDIQNKVGYAHIIESVLRMTNLKISSRDINKEISNDLKKK
jgi:hypothetical protein